MEKLQYLVRCYNHVSALLYGVMYAPHQTPAQSERVRRWQRVRRALAWDLQKLQQTLPNGTQLTLVSSGELSNAPYEWAIKQTAAYCAERAGDTQNVSVDARPTLSSKES